MESSSLDNAGYRINRRAKSGDFSQLPGEIVQVHLEIALLARSSLTHIDRARKELPHLHLGGTRTAAHPLRHCRIAAITSSHGVKLTSPRSIA